MTYFRPNLRFNLATMAQNLAGKISILADSTSLFRLTLTDSIISTNKKKSAQFVSSSVKLITFLSLLVMLCFL